MSQWHALAKVKTKRAYAHDYRYTCDSWGIKIPFLPENGKQETCLFSEMIFLMPTKFDKDTNTLTQGNIPKAICTSSPVQRSAEEE